MSPNNHELIAKIAGYLNQQLKGFYLRDCFSLNKQELIFIFRQRNETFAFELFYDSQESFVFFPLRVSTPRNPQNIFPQLENALVLGVEVVKDDRSFIIKFDEGKTLLFKLYGRNANVILFTKNKVLSVFRENLKSDLAATLPKDLLTPTLDESINILYTQNEYAREYLSHKKFEDTGKQLRTEITKKIDRVGAKINSNQKQLASLANDTDYRTKADLLMANLHAISMESKEVVLQNFYTNLPTKIKLKEGISPQENAERFYRKSKNQIKEKEILLQLKSDLQKELEALLWQKKAIDEAENYHALKALLPEKKEKNTPQKNDSPFRRFEFMGFEILAGRNSKNNDELTFKHSAKTDMWLHVFGAGGSHVVIRNPQKKAIPKEVLEEAASIAAGLSKLKTSSFVPVIYTERKFVRKPKGAPAGAVIVEREKTIVVAPKKI